MRHMMPLAFMLLTSACIGAQPVGKRPYEMDWANRMEDDHPQFEDFEAEAVWQTEGDGAVATAERSREQQLFGDYVLKLAHDPSFFCMLNWLFRSLYNIIWKTVYV